MAYYQGDYYQGDYYRGDPFLGLGAIFGAAKWIGGKLFKKKVAPVVGTAIARQVPAVQRVVRALPAVVAGALGERMMRRPTAQMALMQGPGVVQRTPGIRGTIRRILPGGQTGYECQPGQYMQVRDGEPTGRCLRRRMNVTNPRALRKSLRRVAGFGKLASRARRDIGRAATAVGVSRGRRGPVARHHARIRARA